MSLRSTITIRLSVYLITTKVSVVLVVILVVLVVVLVLIIVVVICKEGSIHSLTKVFLLLYNN
jgi:hypothetical protein